MTNKTIEKKCIHPIAYKCAEGKDGKNPYGICNSCGEVVSLEDYKIMKDSFRRINKRNRQLYRKIKKESQIENKLLGIISHH